MEEVEVSLPRMSLAELLRWRIDVWEAAARAEGWTSTRGAQAAVARAAGIDRQYLNAVINERTPGQLGTDAAMRLSRVLGIPPMVLLLLAVQEQKAEDGRSGRGPIEEGGEE